MKLKNQDQKKSRMMMMMMMIIRSDMISNRNETARNGTSVAEIIYAKRSTDLSHRRSRSVQKIDII